MIVIENGDLIEGDATSATEVDFQIYGLDNNALTNLADGQLAAAKGTLYTANSTDVVTTIIFVNTGAAHNHVNLYHKPSAGTSRRLIPKDLQLESGYSLHFEGGKCCVLDTSGNQIYTDSVAVLKTLFDAYTILMATTNDTPEAITIAAQQVVGRITGGVIKGLSVAELLVLVFSSAMTENVAIQLTTTPSADGKYSGIVEAGTSGATLAFGSLCYFITASSKWGLADATVIAKASGKLGICVLAANDTQATLILLFGKVNAAATFPALTIAAPVFASVTAGAVQVAAPTATTQVVRIIGYGNTADELYFRPDQTYLELV